MKMPQVQTIQNFDGVLALVSDPQAFAAKLQELKRLQDWINEGLRAYGKLDDIEGMTRQARNQMEEAKEFKRQAEEAAKEIKADAARIHTQAENEWAKVVTDVTAQQIEMNQRNAALDDRERGLEAREAAAQSSRQESERILAVANERLRLADDKEKRYEDKLAKLDAAIKG